MTKIFWSKFQKQFVFNIPSSRKVIFVHNLLIVFELLSLFLKISTDFIFMVYLNGARWLTHEYIIEIILIKNYGIKVQKQLQKYDTCTDIRTRYLYIIIRYICLDFPYKIIKLSVFWGIVQNDIIVYQGMFQFYRHVHIIFCVMFWIVEDHICFLCWFLGSLFDHS